MGKVDLYIIHGLKKRGNKILGCLVAVKNISANMKMLSRVRVHNPTHDDPPSDFSDDGYFLVSIIHIFIQKWLRWFLHVHM